MNYKSKIGEIISMEYKSDSGIIFEVEPQLMNAHEEIMAEENEK